jgi:hypothetical protein
MHNVDNDAITILRAIYKQSCFDSYPTRRMTGDKQEVQITLSAEQHQHLQALIEANRTVLDLEYEKRLGTKRQHQENLREIDDEC